MFLNRLLRGAVGPDALIVAIDMVDHFGGLIIADRQGTIGHHDLRDQGHNNRILGGVFRVITLLHAVTIRHIDSTKPSVIIVNLLNLAPMADGLGKSGIGPATYQ